MGQVHSAHVAGQRALGFYRLTFNLGIDVHPISDGPLFNLASFSGEMSIQNRLLASFATPPQRFPLRQQQGHVAPQSLAFFVELDRARIEALEAMRAGGDLQVSMQYYANFVTDDGAPYPQHGQAALTIPQSDWLRILGELGYARAVLIELPVPDGSADPELAAAGNFLARAQQSCLRGEYREAVGLCLGVLEELEKWLPPRSAEPDFKDLRSLDKAERLALVRRAIKIFTHPARHRDEVAARFEWSRRDAVFAVTTLAALLDELGAPDALPPKHSPTSVAVPPAAGTTTP